MSELKAGKYQAYTEYKDSGVEWLGNIPSHWQVIPVKHLAALTPKKSTIDGELLSQECSFLPMEKLKLNSITLDEKRLVSDVYNGYTYFEDGDVLMAKVTPCFENKNIAVASGLLNGVGFGSSEIYVLRSNGRVNNRFLYYRLQEDSFMDIAIAAMSGAGGLKRVPSEIVSGYSLAKPELAEQTQIANFLDHETAKIDTLIEKQQQLIKLLKEKRQAVISHAVTKGLNPQTPMKDSGVEWLGEVPEHWECATKIKYISSLKGRIGFQGLKADEYIDEGPYVVSSAHFNNHIIEWESCPHVSQERYEMDKNIQLLEGDILLMKDGAAMGKLAFVDYLPGKACLNSHLLLFRPLSLNKQYLYIPEYLYYLFQTDFFQGFIKVNGTGSTFLGISQQAIGNYQLVIPDINEQLMIANHLKNVTVKIDDLVKMQLHAINLLQERRTALISAAVTGKIDVRHWEQPND